jgi:hypothetical protein
MWTVCGAGRRSAASRSHSSLANRPLPDPLDRAVHLRRSSMEPMFRRTNGQGRLATRDSGAKQFVRPRRRRLLLKNLSKSEHSERAMSDRTVSKSLHCMGEIRIPLCCGRC